MRCSGLSGFTYLSFVPSLGLVCFTFPLTLAPGEETTTYFSFNPVYDVDHEGMLLVTSNEPIGTREHAQIGAGKYAGDFTDCFFGNWSLPLLITNPSHSPEILRNRFEGNFRSIDLRYLTTSVTIVGNSFHEALQSDLSPGYHLFVEDGSTPGQFATAVFAPGDISGNDFTGNGRVYNSAQGVDLVVEGNWWGQAGGPLATQTEVSGTAPIDVDPAASTPFTNGSTTPLD